MLAEFLLALVTMPRSTPTSAFCFVWLLTTELIPSRLSTLKPCCVARALLLLTTKRRTLDKCLCLLVVVAAGLGEGVAVEEEPGDDETWANSSRL